MGRLILLLPIAALVLAASPAVAGDPTKLPATLNNVEREADKNLPAQIALGQKGLITGDAANRGLNTLLREQNSRSSTSELAILTGIAAREAEVNIAPLQKALAGFDADALALEAVQSGIARSSWLHPAHVEVAREPSLAGRTAFVAATAGGKAALIDVVYYMEPQGARIEAIANIAIARRGRMKPDLVAYHRITSVALLATPSFDPRVNVGTWAANHAELAKTGLAAIFTRLGELVSYAVDMSPQQIESLNAKDIAKTYVASRYGPLVPELQTRPGTTTIWARGLVSAFRIPAGK